VRRIIDPNAPAPRYVPVLNVGGYIPDLTVDMPAREFRMQYGSRCFFAWMPTPDGGVVWFANPPMAREPDRGVLSTMSDADWRRWHTDDMLVIGDAAHATAPSAGQGASMALEDAVILATCLPDCPDIPCALAVFESLRRERVERIVKHGARSANSKAAGPVGRVIRDLILPIVFRRAARDGGRSMMWLQGHHIDFDQPAVAPVSSLPTRLGA
jgi:FAD-dependent urate hydroxylase